MHYDEIIGIAHQQWLFPGMAEGLALCDHRFHSMQRDIQEQRREYASLGDPRFAERILLAIHDTRCEPGVDDLPKRGIGLQFLDHHGLVDMIEGLGNIGIEHEHRVAFNRYPNSSEGLMTSSTQAM